MKQKKSISKEAKWDFHEFVVAGKNNCLGNLLLAFCKEVKREIMKRAETPWVCVWVETRDGERGKVSRVNVGLHGLHC